MDRMVTLGCMPTTETIVHRQGHRHLAQLRHAVFSERREIGIFNIGGGGSITADGVKYELGYKDCLYITQGTKEIRQRRRGESREVLHGVGPGTPGV